MGVDFEYLLVVVLNWDKVYLYNGFWIFVRKLKYYVFFDWLMEVVIKIEIIDKGCFGFIVDLWGIEIIDYLKDD